MGVWGQRPQQAEACAEGKVSELASNPCRRHSQKLVLYTGASTTTCALGFECAGPANSLLHGLCRIYPEKNWPNFFFFFKSRMTRLCEYAVTFTRTDRKSPLLNSSHYST